MTRSFFLLTSLSWITLAKGILATSCACHLIMLLCDKCSYFVIGTLVHDCHKFICWYLVQFSCCTATHHVIHLSSRPREHDLPGTTQVFFFFFQVWHKLPLWLMVKGQKSQDHCDLSFARFLWTEYQVPVPPGFLSSTSGRHSSRGLLVIIYYQEIRLD